MKITSKQGYLLLEIAISLATASLLSCSIALLIMHSGNRQDGITQRLNALICANRILDQVQQEHTIVVNKQEHSKRFTIDITSQTVNEPLFGSLNPHLKRATITVSWLSMANQTESLILTGAYRDE